MPECKHQWSAWGSRNVPDGRDKRGNRIMMMRRYCKCGAEQTRKAKDVLLTLARQ